MLPSTDDLAALLEEAGAMALSIGPEDPRRRRDGSWVTDADVQMDLADVASGRLERSVAMGGTIRVSAPAKSSAVTVSAAGPGHRSGAPIKVGKE